MTTTLKSLGGGASPRSLYVGLLFFDRLGLDWDPEHITMIKCLSSFCSSKSIGYLTTLSSKTTFLYLRNSTALMKQFCCGSWQWYRSILKREKTCYVRIISDKKNNKKNPEHNLSSRTALDCTFTLGNRVWRISTWDMTIERVKLHKTDTSCLVSERFWCSNGYIYIVEDICWMVLCQFKLWRNWKKHF